MQTITNHIRQSASSLWHAHVIHPLQNAWQHHFVSRWKSISMWKNSLWWWSLTAIAVYGISTTVPKELIRQQRHQSSPPPQKSNMIVEEEDL
jgi:hypothetical protein